jgi:hypothetical protein
MPGCLRGANGVVETARVQNPVGIKVVRLHPENTGEKEHVVVGHPNFAGFDFADFPSRGVIHARDLQFDRELVLRPSPTAAQPSDLRSYDVQVSHGTRTTLNGFSEEIVRVLEQLYRDVSSKAQPPECTSGV